MGTNILRSYTDLYCFCASFFWKITDSHRLINVKIFFMCGVWENIQLNISSVSQIVQKFPDWTIFSGESNILIFSRYWFPTGFLSKWNTALLQEVPNSVLCVGPSKLNTLIEAVVPNNFQKFQGSTDISARELFF